MDAISRPPDAVLRAPARPAGAPPPERVVFTTREVTALLGLSKKSVLKLVAEERIPHVRVGRALRYPQPALNAWLADPRRWEGEAHVAA